MRNLLRLAAIGVWAGLAGLTLAQQRDDVFTVHVDEAVTPTNEKLIFTIAIPAFQPMEGSRVLKSGTLNSILYNDLEMSGYFEASKNQSFVEETAARDRRKKRLNLIRMTPEAATDWRSIGADFVVVGDYNLTAANKIWASSILYSVADGKRIVGREWPERDADNYRQLAHWIADEIHRYITSKLGIASTRIAYVGRIGKNKEVFLMDADGAGQHRLTYDQSLVYGPTWGMNGTEIYYPSDKDHQWDLCGVYVTGKTSWFISRRPGTALSPCYNAQNQRIAVSLSKDGNSEIYTMDRNGQKLKRLTYGKAIDLEPSWSPDGSQIVFLTDRRGIGYPQIYLMNADGSDQRLLTPEGSYCVSPAWSPDGDSVVFVRRSSDTKNNIYSINVDGSGLRQLTHKAGDNEDPCWAPNGEHLAFCSDRSGKFQIYMMRTDGSNVRQLTTQGENSSPAWSPYPQ